VVQRQWLAGSNPKGWAPEKKITENVAATFANVRPGVYKFAIGLFLDKQDELPIYKLGIQGRTASGWYVLDEKVQCEPAAE
jgi:hypothetical protein